VSRMPVRISRVAIQCQRLGTGRITYRLVLSCGCQFWEDHPVGMPPPAINEPAYCYRSHDKPAPTLSSRPIQPVADATE
jgi:hypothetical protein